MSFDSFSEFLHMGGHALYVWLSYAAGLIFLLLNLILPATNRNKLLKDLWQRQRRNTNQQSDNEEEI